MARDVTWERLKRITPRDAVVTGDAAEDAETPPVPLTPAVRARDPLLKRPLIVFVHEDPDVCDGDCNGACERYFAVEADVFSKEKILLALRAFRPIRISPEHAAAEPLLAKAVAQAKPPQLVLLDVARGETTVLAGSKASASRVYSEMKRTAARFYKEKLDSVVKKHQKLLGQHDKLAQEEGRVREQEMQSDDERRSRKLEDALEAIEDEKDELDQKIEDLWDLTLRKL